MDQLIIYWRQVHVQEFSVHINLVFLSFLLILQCRLGSQEKDYSQMYCYQTDLGFLVNVPPVRIVQQKQSTDFSSAWQV